MFCGTISNKKNRPCSKNGTKAVKKNSGLFHFSEIVSDWWNTNRVICAGILPL